MELRMLAYEKMDGIALVTLDRPEALNAMNRELLEDLVEALRYARDDEGVGVVIITGTGKAFIAGADIKAMNAMTPGEFRSFCLLIQQVTRDIRTLEKPVIAAVNGWALGAGAEVACACDLRIAADTAKFGFPEPKVGLTNTSGVTQILPRLVGLGRAKEMLMVCDIIDAYQAERIGLVNKVVPSDQLLSAAMEMGRKILCNSPVAVRLAKATVDVGAEADLNTAMAFEVEAIVTAFCSEDRKEGLSAFIEKRKPQFTGKL